MIILLFFVASCIIITSGCQYRWIDGKQYPLDECLAKIETHDQLKHFCQNNPFLTCEPCWTLRSYKQGYGETCVKLNKVRERLERKLYAENGVNQRIINAIMERKIILGMTKKDVIASWGQPNDINKTVTTYGTDEQWVYGFISLYSDTLQFLYFDDGILTSWQD